MIRKKKIVENNNRNASVIRNRHTVVLLKLMLFAFSFYCIHYFKWKISGLFNISLNCNLKSILFIFTCDPKLAWKCCYFLNACYWSSCEGLIHAYDFIQNNQHFITQSSSEITDFFLFDVDSSNHCSLFNSPSHLPPSNQHLINRTMSRLTFVSFSIIHLTQVYITVRKKRAVASSI